MASLKTLLYTDFATVNVIQELFVGNDTFSANNGGCCCAWTVPAGTSYIRFEMWGGGGGGAGGCCCQQGCAGGPGSYAIKTLSGSEVVPGCVYTICGAGSTQQANTCCGFPGNTSYVTGFNLSNFCARGGCRGNTVCQFCNNYNLVSCDYTCCSTGGNLNVHAIVSGVKNAYYCYGGIQQYVSVASATVSGPIIGPNGCSIVGAGLCSSNPVPVFPGGGGHSAITHSGNCYCGWWGAPGLVLVTFG